MMTRAMATDNTSARRNNNRRNAMLLAKTGIYVFPSNGKTPLIPRFTKADTLLDATERDAAVVEFEEKHGKPPAHVGATVDITVIKKLWALFPDAVPSVSCGPSKLVVLDADKKDNGPELLGAFFNDNGGVPKGVPVIPTKSGGQHLVFRDADSAFSNKAGLLKKSYGTDVRGTGGQFVAPGSWREDGARYGTEADLVNFLRAHVQNTIPALPEFVVEAIGTQPEGSTSLNDTDPVFKELMERLGAEDWPDFELTFDAKLGKYCLDCIRERAPAFGDLYDMPSTDMSTNRFKAARFLLGAFPRMTVEEYASFCAHWEGSGKYDDRALTREFMKAQKDPEHVPADGSAFDAVEDASKVGRFVYLAEIKKATLRLLEWCVKFFIARGTTSIASGQWGAGKTAVYSDIALHVAHGLKWRGRKVTKGVVVYVALENAEDVERRVRTWCDTMERAGHELGEGAFVIHRGPCGLFDPNGKATRDEKELIKIATDAAAHYGLPVAMVVIDTLSQSIAPGDDKTDGGIYTASLQRIANATGGHVVALHHPTKAGDQVRGDGAFQGNVDTIVVISRDKAGRGTIEAGSKFRIGNPAKVKFSYRLKSFVIGTDDDGDDIEVVLAVEGDNSIDVAVDDDDDNDIPTLVQSDRRQDRLRSVVEIFEREAERQKADDESLPSAAKRLELQSGEIERAVNARRVADGLEALGRSTIQDHIRAAVESGSLEVAGTKGRPSYRLA